MSDTVFVVIAFTGNSAEIDGAYVVGVYGERWKAEEMSREETRSPDVVEVGVFEEQVRRS